MLGEAAVMCWLVVMTYSDKNNLVNITLDIYFKIRKNMKLEADTEIIK